MKKKYIIHSKSLNLYVSRTHSLTEKLSQANQYNNIGDAMRAAIDFNTHIDTKGAKDFRVHSL